MNLILSVLFFALNTSLILSFKAIISVKKQAIIGTFLMLMIIVLNFIYGTVPRPIFFILIIFSMAIIVLRFLSRSLNVYRGSKALTLPQKTKINHYKVVTFDFIFPALIFIYQLLLIWSTELQQELVNN